MAPLAGKKSLKKKLFTSQAYKKSSICEIQFLSNRIQIFRSQPPTTRKVDSIKNSFQMFGLKCGLIYINVEHLRRSSQKQIYFFLKKKYLI